MPAARGIGGGIETIFVAEDHFDVRSVAKAMLSRSGYTVLCVVDGAEALKIAHEYDERIDLLLIDVVMSAMNGRELAIRLTALLPNVRVLYASGYADTTIVRHN